MNFSKYPSVVLTLIWFSSFCLLPVLLWQGYFLRRAALRLPEAGPPNSGRFCSSETEMMIVGVGDSVIAGTGIGSLSNSVTARVAQTLASRFSTGVNWLARGISGAKLEDLLARLKDAGAEKRVWPTQFGFKAGFGTIDALFATRRIMDDIWNYFYSFIIRNDTKKRFLKKIF